MIHRKPQVIIYVRRDSIILAGKKIKPIRFTIPTEVLQNLEIVSEARFIKGCSDFFTAQELKNKRCQIILDDSIVFSKPLIDVAPSMQPAACQTFIDLMPFAAGTRVCIIDQTQPPVLYATNARLYEAVIAALDRAGAGKVSAVTPAKVFGVSVTDNLVAAIETYCANTVTARKCNFTDSKPL